MCLKKYLSSATIPVTPGGRKRTLPSLHASILIERGETSSKALGQGYRGISLNDIPLAAREKRGEGRETGGQKLGRPVSLNMAAKDPLKKMAARSPTLSNAQLAKRLAEKGHPTVAVRTIGRTLAAMGFRRQFPNRKPLLTDRHKKARLEWCLKNRERDWSRVVFTDETTLRFTSYRQKALVRNSRPTVGTVKHLPSLMLWCGISARGATPIAPIGTRIDSAGVSRYLGGLPDTYHENPVSRWLRPAAGQCRSSHIQVYHRVLQTQWDRGYGVASNVSRSLSH